MENMIVNRIVALLIGYACGLFLSGYAYSKSKKKDITKMGSGNAGTTNTFRIFGWKGGLITLIGDVSKPIVAILVTWLIFHNSSYETVRESVRLLEFYAGFGCILGVISFFIQTVVFGELGIINLSPQYKLEIYIVAGIIMIMAIVRHRANIGRLLNGTENKFSFSKQKDGEKEGK